MKLISTVILNMLNQLGNDCYELRAGMVVTAPPPPHKKKSGKIRAESGIIRANIRGGGPFFCLSKYVVANFRSLYVPMPIPEE